LKKEVQEGRFRDDLFYRLNVVPIYLPPLSERRDDIPLLIQHFVKQFSAENGKSIKGIAGPAMAMLSQREWPGNIREIENSIERAVVMSGPDVDILNLQHFYFGEPITLGVRQSIENPSMTLRDVEKDLILKTLQETNDNRTKTADVLGISVRTLRNKLNEYRKEGIDI
jgi:DNA-binding NtrC family response regulator